MRISKFGWLAAVLAVAAVVGAVAYKPTTTEAAVTAAALSNPCIATATPNQVTCTLTISESTMLQAANYQVTLVPGTGTAAFVPGGTFTATTSVAGCTATVTGVTATTYTVTTANVAVCTTGVAGTITVTETVNILTSGTTSRAVTGTNTGGAANSNASTNNVVPVPPLTVTKACTTPAVPGSPAGTAVVGQPFSCPVTVTFPAGAVVPAQTATVTVTNGTVTGGPFVCPAGANPCTFTETITPTTAGTIPTQSVAIGGATFTPALTGITAVIAAGLAPVTATLVGCQIGFPWVVGFPLTTTATPGQTVVCRVAFTDAGPPSAGATTGVNSGTVTVNLIAGGLAATGFQVQAVSGNLQGAPVQGNVAASVRCGAPAGATSIDGCTFVDIGFTANQTLITTGLPANIGFNLTYQPDPLGINAGTQLTVPNAFQIIQAVAAFVQPTSLAITCAGFDQTGAIVGALSLVRPGPVGPGQVPGFASGTALGVGVLPGAINCTVTPLVNGVPAAVAPGTIEVSSLNGTILNLSGTLTTNVRIACGDAAVFTPGQAINPNSCTGVRFAVLGQGVGNVEVRARYEPTPAAAGLQEVEAAGFVTFVAPVVSVSLTLDPDPVAVGARGTATATLRQLFTPNCNIAGGFQTCIDPATGLPLQVGSLSGSALNGMVVFTIENTAIARFQDVGVANAGTTLNIGVTSTAQQTFRACGAFGGGASANPFIYTNPTGALAPFFGGCNTASAQYIGVEQGATNVAATFIPFLPGAASVITAASGFTSGFALSPFLSSLNFFSPNIGPSTTFRTLQVAGPAPATTLTVNLVRGCNNVTPTVSESASAYAMRVNPANSVIAIWEHQPATNTFRGAPGAGSPASAAAVADLDRVERLRPVFVCVNAPAVLTQPVI